MRGTIGKIALALGNKIERSILLCLC